MSSTDLDLDKLKSILKEIDRVKKDHETPGAALQISANDLAAVMRSFGGPNHNLAYLVLTSLCGLLRDQQQKSKASSEQATESVARLFIPHLEEGFRAITDDDTRPPMLLLIALLQIDSDVGTLLFLREGTIQWLEEQPDLFPQEPTTIHRICTTLSIASGLTRCRGAVREHFLSWLEGQYLNSKDERTRASAAVSLTKLSRMVQNEDDLSKIPQQLGDEHTIPWSRNDQEIANTFKSLIINGKGESEDGLQVVIDSVEGLAYLTDRTNVKESLSKDTGFLKHLFALVPPIKKGNSLIAQGIDEGPVAKANISLVYGSCIIILHLVQYAPRLTEEESQVEKLRKLASRGTARVGEPLKSANDADEVRESDEIVATRGKRLISAGVLPVLATLARSESMATRQAIGQSYLSLVEPKENRGAVLQNGGGKAIRSMISSFAAPSSSTKTLELPIQSLPTIQALAKLTITTDPRILFGPSDSDTLDAIRPMKQLLLHPHSSLLQKFESLMALTNLASTSQKATDRIVTDDIVGQLDSLILDDHPLVRRAANELLCNVVSTERLMKRYGAGAELVAVPPKGVVSRLHILLALSDSDDLATRKAASGTLATLLSISPSCAKALLSIEKGPQGVFAILGDLIDSSRASGQGGPPLQQNDSLQLVHRGVVCLQRIFTSAKPAGMEEKIIEAARLEKLTSVLANCIKPLMDDCKSTSGTGLQEILLTATECLRWLTDRGI